MAVVGINDGLLALAAEATGHNIAQEGEGSTVEDCLWRVVNAANAVAAVTVPVDLTIDEVLLAKAVITKVKGKQDSVNASVDALLG